MPVENTTSANVKQAVPFLSVSNMEASLRFYVDGLGFKMSRWWIPDDHQGEDKPDGRIRWCWLELGNAAIMLQEYLPERKPKETLGSGVTVCFQCDDALALYREFKSRGVQDLMTDVDYLSDTRHTQRLEATASRRQWAQQPHRAVGCG